MEAKGYQGWSNYETWATKLWLDNVESDYRMWCANAEEAYADAVATSYFTRDRVAVHSLADVLREYHEGNAPTLHGPYGDLINSALAEVNWTEIAESLIEDVDKPEDDSEDE